MPLIVAERNNLATTQAARITHVSLHTADPGTTGASETGARLPVTWGAAANGTVTGGELSFDGGTALVTHFGYWSAATGGTFRGGNPLGAQQQQTATGSVKVVPNIPIGAS